MYVFYPFSAQRILSHLVIKVLIIIILLTGASRTQVVHAAGGTAHFSIAPGVIPHSNETPRGYFSYTSLPGFLIQDRLHITNVGTARGSVDLYAVDATTDQMSGVTFLTPTDPRHDVGAWITLSSQKITLNPGQSQDVPFRVRIPSTVRPGQHGGGIIARGAVDQAISSNSGAIHTTVHVQAQEIVGVLVNLPGTLMEKLNVTGITYDRKSTSQNLLVGLANTGTQIVHPSGMLQISDKKRHLLQNVPVKLAAILPQTAISYPMSIENNTFSSGTYTASISLSYEGGHHVSYETTFVISLPQTATSRIVLKPVTKQVLLRAVSATTASSSNFFFFNTLTLWHSIPVLLVIMLLCAVLLLWCWKRYKPLTKVRQRSK
jgi:hypothetical protein